VLTFGVGYAEPVQKIGQPISVRPGKRQGAVSADEAVLAYQAVNRESVVYDEGDPGVISAIDIEGYAVQTVRGHLRSAR
jgi:hypothetical protein